MSWFFLALIGPFLYAITNHIDKILLEKYFKKSGVGTLILFSSLISVFALPFIYWADPAILSVSGTDILVLAVVGILDILVLLFYFLALKDDEASVVIVFYQLVPVFGLVLGYFILGEVLTQAQLIAMALIIFGTTIISFEIDIENNFKLRHRTIAFMLAASFCWALGAVIFKAVALEEDVWRSLFWEHLMLVVVGIGIFICVRSYRTHFLSAIRDNSKAIISLNFANEGLFMLGNIVFAFAYLLAPISLVLLSNSFQTIFVMAIGIFLTIYFPNVSTEKIHARHIWQKIIAICITGIGTYLLLSS
ncbi:MAG: EamA family transporter [bacterium]|nr:EamA family transporter [bacterium]